MQPARRSLPARSLLGDNPRGAGAGRRRHARRQTRWRAAVPGYLTGTGARPPAWLNHTLVSNGSAFNQKLNPAFLRGGKGAETLAGLLNGYFRLGGMQLQWNLVDREMLQAAQCRPEDYRDLIVRVSGYSAHFTGLERVVQDDFIARMEHGV